jgi:hypothetical protein
MGKMKELSLQFRGYMVRGEATLHLWGGGEGFIDMKPSFIPKDKLSHTLIKRSVNDNGFGCESITQAVVDIYKVYGPVSNPYEQFDRTIVLNKQQCLESMKGIQI